MTALQALIKRNTRLFVKDKGTFFTAMITPMILMVLYVTFLGNVYKDSFVDMTASFGVTLSDEILNGCAGGQLLASLLAVCTVTVAFCSNMIMVQDKVSGARKDITLSPVSPATLALGYYLSTYLVTLLICLVATALGFGYLAMSGWFLSVGDVICVLADVVLMTLFGTALSGVVNFFLNSQGQISAVGSIVSACYGFICGAYMPISSFAPGLQKVLSFLPGTYGTALLKNHTMQGSLDAMERAGLPKEGTTLIKDMMDCNVYFFDQQVSPVVMAMIVLGFSLAMVGLYLLFYKWQNKKHA
ncbi:MAG: ABC transporter permease [Clostridia bacterium]|nr:ABC transporter permease [Clostridia bacterium]